MSISIESGSILSSDKNIKRLVASSDKLYSAKILDSIGGKALILIDGNKVPVSTEVPLQQGSEITLLFKGFAEGKIQFQIVSDRNVESLLKSISDYGLLQKFAQLNLKLDALTLKIFMSLFEDELPINKETIENIIKGLGEHRDEKNISFLTTLLKNQLPLENGISNLGVILSKSMQELPQEMRKLFSSEIFKELNEIGDSYSEGVSDSLSLPANLSKSTRFFFETDNSKIIYPKLSSLPISSQDTIETIIDKLSFLSRSFFSTTESKIAKLLDYPVQNHSQTVLNNIAVLLNRLIANLKMIYSLELSQIQLPIEKLIGNLNKGLKDELTKMQINKLFLAANSGEINAETSPDYKTRLLEMSETLKNFYKISIQAMENFLGDNDKAIGERFKQIQSEVLNILKTIGENTILENENIEKIINKLSIPKTDTPLNISQIEKQLSYQGIRGALWFMSNKLERIENLFSILLTRLDTPDISAEAATTNFMPEISNIKNELFALFERGLGLQFNLNNTISKEGGEIISQLTEEFRKILDFSLQFMEKLHKNEFQTLREQRELIFNALKSSKNVFKDENFLVGLKTLFPSEEITDIDLRRLLANFAKGQIFQDKTLSLFQNLGKALSMANLANFLGHNGANQMESMVVFFPIKFENKTEIGELRIFRDKEQDNGRTKKIDLENAKLVLILNTEFLGRTVVLINTQKKFLTCSIEVDSSEKEKFVTAYINEFKDRLGLLEDFDYVGVDVKVRVPKKDNLPKVQKAKKKITLVDMKV